MLLFWVCICYSTLCVVSIILLVYNIKHIVIWNRRPFLVLLEQSTAMVWLIMTTFDFACTITMIAGTLTVSIALIRVTYIYQYLVTESPHLSSVCKIFWIRNVLLLRNAIALPIILYILRLVEPTVYYFSSRDDAFIASCKSLFNTKPFALVFFIPLFFTQIIIILFSFMLVKKKVKDRIGLKIEFIGLSISTCLFTMFTITLNYGIQFQPLWSLVIHMINLHFWAAWIPLLFLLLHNIRAKKYIPIHGQFFDFNTLKSLSRQFFCEENVKFLDKYEFYCESPSTSLYQDILNDFIRDDSPMQLNINEADKLAALDSPEGLVLVHEHISQLVQDNLIPYLNLENANYST
eukprot:NODE_7_length_67686_cov_1.621421.p15 type:complete len:349 gc:universal NODE_7_length_67686_cov_1.621421:18730-17684(-)